MDETNNQMISDIKNPSIPYLSETYPLISSLKQFLESQNPNIHDFENWLNFTQNLLSQNNITFQQFILKISFIKDNDIFSTELFKKIKILSSQNLSLKNLISENNLGPICFVTPELGRWSTVGGLGVMVDELSQGLNSAGQKVMMISPYYDRNRKGETEYLKNDPFNIKYLRNIEVSLDKKYNFGVHMGVGNNGIEYYFIHNYEIFPKPYPEGRVDDNFRRVCLFCKASLQLLCDIRKIPAVIVTNDWYTGLVAAYGKIAFGGIFSGTTFMHICHNLEPEYEGRFYPTREQGTLDYIHQINRDLLVDPWWKQIVINPSRCALIMSDQWGTVSHSYKEDLLRSSPLSGILKQKPQPFSYPNGVFKENRLKQLTDKAGIDHLGAREYIQKKYFGYQQMNPDVPIYAFVGRITRQKGVHLILEVAEELINKTGGQINILVGGMGVHSDPYFRDCENRIRHLRGRYPNCFWANPSEFFVDGPKINIGADFGLMPSLFEPGGIVQHEFFLGRTPVIAFRTGGLKDTVFEFLWDSNKGNGLTFDNYCRNGLMDAMWRSINLFKNKEKYEICRENAFNSVIDVKDVSKAWGREFYRLKGKVFFNVREVLGDEDNENRENINNNNNDKDNKVMMENKNINNINNNNNRENMIKGFSQNNILNPFGGFNQKKNYRNNIFSKEKENNNFNIRVGSNNNLNIEGNKENQNNNIFTQFRSNYYNNYMNKNRNNENNKNNIEQNKNLLQNQNNNKSNLIQNKQNNIVKSKEPEKINSNITNIINPNTNNNNNINPNTNNTNNNINLNKQYNNNNNRNIKFNQNSQLNKNENQQNNNNNNNNYNNLNFNQNNNISEKKPEPKIQNPIPNPIDLINQQVKTTLTQKKPSKNNFNFKPHNDLYYYSPNIKNTSFIPGNTNTINQNNNINNFNQNNNINNLIVINNSNSNFNKTKNALNNIILITDNGILNGNNQINEKSNFYQNNIIQTALNENLNNKINLNNTNKIIEENNNKIIKEEFASINQISKNKVHHKGFIVKKGLSNNNINNNNILNNSNNNNNNEKRNVLFTFKGEDLPKNTESVQICGSYDKWNVRHPLKYDKARNLWFVNLTLNRGKIFYKYIVNSKWVVNPREEVDNDGNNENNVIVL